MHEKLVLMKKRDPFDTEKNAQEREDLEFKRQQILNRSRELLARTMSTDDGRELIHNLLSMTQLYISSFDTNALSMAFNEGRRSVGLDLQSLMKSDLYLLMLEEANERTRTKQQRRN